MMTFSEYMRMREGLWLADKNAVQGLSQIDNTALLPNKGSKRPTAKPVIPKTVVKPLNPKIGLLPKLPALMG